MNTGITIVTFLVVFLIQNTQNRDAVAIQLKLDELIRGVEGGARAWLNWRIWMMTRFCHLRQELERIHKQAANGNVTSIVEDR